jgi:predicted PurR-regulated permease PerM
LTTISGLPAHALLVHAVVVLAPLLALLEILCAFWPAARRRLAWLVLAFGVAVMVLTPLTVSAGEWLYDQSPQHTPILETHEERGQWATYFAVGLLVVAIAQAVQHWLESRSEEPKRALAVVLAVVAVVVGVASIVAVVRIGDSGAHSVWGGG